MGPGNVKNGKVNIEAKVSVSNPVLNQRFNMTINYFMAVKLLLSQAYSIEQSHLGEPLGDFFTEIRCCVSTILILLGAALEAVIYERFQDIDDNILQIRGFDKDEFNKTWLKIKEWSGLLIKYKKFAKLSDKDLDLSDPKYEALENLKDIRNALAHYVPRWDFEQNSLEEIEKIFCKLPSSIVYSPFFPPSEPLFPLRCMSSGFGQWAVNTSLDFIKFFEDAIPIDNRYEYLRDELQIVPQEK